MAPPTPDPVPLPKELPPLPVASSQFLQHVAGNPHVPVRELLKPYREYESALRAYFAQDPEHEFVQDNTVNLVDVFGEHSAAVGIERRDLEGETTEVKDRYIMQLDDKQRKKSGEKCIQSTLKDFRDNFNIFTEGALMNLDWSNVVVAGSAVLTPLLVVPDEHAESKRTLRHWYHEILAPASDIDLFLYGITDEKEAIAKIEAIETTIKDNLLWETTTIRTRNTITIVSQYPNRHVQIVLRLYRSISEILTGFDVNCSAFAYDGSRVLAPPRALTACIMQCNDIDLSRRSPSYENRLSKYSHRGFEVYCPFLDRSKIDPTIFERSFARTAGLARLLVLEALPKPEQREQYQAKRREEMGRPEVANSRLREVDRKNKKAMTTDEVAEWDFEDISGYQKFAIPYGEGYNAKKIEKLFFKKDLLLNAEWNKMNRPPHRTVNLHRHPVFFGNVADVVGDCCGFCPEPLNDEEREVAEEEGKIYVKGPITFLSDDPGRQEIGSFNPLGPEDYTDMAYVGSSQRVCEAIVDNDVDCVKSWCEQEGVDVNVRDFCGRTPLHLACLSTSTDIEVVQCLIDHGARLVARLQDGRTALHIAAARGRADMVSALLRKSAENEHQRDERKNASKTAQDTEDVEMKDAGEDGDEDDSDKDSEDSSFEDFDQIHGSDANSTRGAPTATTGGFVKVQVSAEDNALDGEEEEEIDDVYDINVTDWDYLMSPLHHAILLGNDAVIETLVSDFGADIRKPMLPRDTRYRNVNPHAFLSLILALHTENPCATVSTLLKLGASCTQATNQRDGSRTSAFHYVVKDGSLEILESLFEHDAPGALSMINNAHRTDQWSRNNIVTPLGTALFVQKDTLKLIQYLLTHGAHAQITADDIVRNLKPAQRQKITKEILDNNLKELAQPLEYAIMMDADGPLDVDIVAALLQHGADPNQMCQMALYYYSSTSSQPKDGFTPLDKVRQRIEQTLEIINDVPVRYQYGDVSYGTYEDSLLDEFPLGSYRRAAAKLHLQFLRDRAAEAKKRTDSLSESHYEKELAKKKEDAKRLLEKLLRIESLLLEAGAKTYHELYPEVLPEYLKSRGGVMETFRLPRAERSVVEVTPADPQPPKVKEFDPFKFDNPYLGEGNAVEGYLRLFEAIWRGTPEDLETVKMLTSGPSGEGENLIPALRISVKDDYRFNALFIALVRRNDEMVDLIMQIVKEQYEPAEPVVQRPQDSDTDSDEESVDEEPTVDDSGVEHNVLKCDISPWDVGWWSPLSYAIYRNSIPLLRRVLQLARAAAAASNLDRDPDSAVQEFFISELESPSLTIRQRHQYFATHLNLRSHLRLAIILGRTEILEELMKTVSFGIAYAELVQKDEVLQKALNTKHYRGLSIHGAKKKDWVNASFPAESTNESDKQQKPLHLAAYYGNLQSLQWLQSSRPWECLQEFIANNPGTQQVRLLQENGAQVLLEKGLGLKTTLLPHLVIRGWRKNSKQFGNPEATLRYLFSLSPGAMEAKTTLGLTPALFAVRERNKEAVTALVAAGADFTARDTNARNILHHLLTPHDHPTSMEIPDLQEFLSLLPPAAVANAWSQRASLTLSTPLVRFIALSAALDRPINDEILTFLLSASEGVGLFIPDIAGNLPIHELFLKRQYKAALKLLKHSPSLVAVENGNGRTPVEILEASWRGDVCSTFPEVGVPNPGEVRSNYGWHKERPVLQRELWAVLKGRPVEGGSVEVEEVRRKLVELDIARGVARRVSGIAKAPVIRDRWSAATETQEVDSDFGDVVALF
ncbi:hypothetical protein K440DRAFT_549813 [Wilcoxina mikolae CBS 423.85]|nr:hypothetical protein K440DRAFT_549813 [Wilcoxina mikolae CBS 423.85]